MNTPEWFSEQLRSRAEAHAQTLLNDAMKVYRYTAFNPRLSLLRTVSHNAFRVSGSLNGRNNLRIINIYRPVLDPAWMSPATQPYDKMYEVASYMRQFREDGNTR